MGSFRMNKRGAAEPVPEPTPEAPMDLGRFDRLIETSERLRDLGVDYETIQRRASADDVSWNEALEAIDRERFGG